LVVVGGLDGAQSGGDHSGDQSAGVIDLADQQIAELADGELVDEDRRQARCRRLHQTDLQPPTTALEDRHDQPS
jgi:hypothetical protein